MKGHGYFDEIAKQAFKEIPGDEVSINVASGKSSFTRLANNRITSDVSYDDDLVEILVAFGNKSGKARTNSFTKEALIECGKKAAEIAKNSLPNEFYPWMNKKSEYKKCEIYFDSTANVSAKDKTNILKTMFEITKAKEMNLAGNLKIDAKERLYLNSHGVSNYHRFTRFGTELIVQKDRASGYSYFLSPNFDEFKVEDVIEKAINKCAKAQNLINVPLGKWDVVLEPAAVGELMEWLNFISFNTEAYDDKTSFMNGNFGKKLLGDNISIYDDPYDPRGFTLPFDMEGTPKEKVFFVKNGIVTDMVYNREKAKKYGKKSTGHALFISNEPTSHAGADNLFIANGESSINEMVKKVKKGLYITRFHYINGNLKPEIAMMTGLTRDGTFLIENGEITKGVKNLRFTDSIVEAFNRVELISKELRRIPSWWSEGGCMVTPAMLIRDFQFTGRQEE